MLDALPHRRIRKPCGASDHGIRRSWHVATSFQSRLTPSDQTASHSAYRRAHETDMSDPPPEPVRTIELRVSNQKAYVWDIEGAHAHNIGRGKERRR
jgi:hypothetical protein